MLLQHPFEIDLFPFRYGAQFIECLRLDLANSFSRDSEFFSDAVKRLRFAIAQTKPQLDDFSLAY